MIEENCPLLSLNVDFSMNPDMYWSNDVSKYHDQEISRYTQTFQKQDAYFQVKSQVHELSRLHNDVWSILIIIVRLLFNCFLLFFVALFGWPNDQLLG